MLYAVNCGCFRGSVSRDAEGVVEMMLDVTQNHAEPLTAECLFGWPAALFPTGHSGMRRVAVGDWPSASAGPTAFLDGK